MADPVVHFEIMGTDREQLARFYADLFGWHVESLEQPPYGVIDTHSGSGINGGIGEVPSAADQYVAVYASTSDIHATFDKAVSMGAEVLMPVDEVPGIVTFAILRDPQGTVFGIIQPQPTDAPGVSAGDGVPVDWFEILCPEPKALRDFYVELFGWTPMEGAGEALGNSDFEYHQVHTGEGGLDGGIGSSRDGKSHFALYATVDDLQPYLDRAEAIGGATELNPMQVSHIEFAQLRDPQGNVFGLYKRRPEDGSG